MTAATATVLAAVVLLAAAPQAPRPNVDRVDERAAWSRLVRQVELGPRPAGSPASRKLARELKAALPRGAFQAVPGGLRNVVGFVPGRDPSRTVVVGAHYDTKDLPRFVGANDGAGGTALVVQLARTIEPRQLRPSVVFILFDGEESPDDAQDFLTAGLRGSRAAAPRYKHAEAMILVDLVADRDLSLPREGYSDPKLWSRLRAAARRVGTAAVFPAGTQPAIADDHLPFLELGVPAIDLIDFDYPCWHRTCDNLSRVSVRSLDAVGETVLELLRSL
ncbi:MAG TPA: M28 family metallopeptidase [Gaiellaceae bacterium]|nr:M28 family metallopeptidase [Gaiellaceae bacterium]